MSRDTITIKVWENSPIIGKTIADIRTRYKVDIKKVTRGEASRNPVDSIEIKPNDYISFEDNLENIKKFLKVVNSQ